jgi:hypothetical protein
MLLYLLLISYSTAMVAGQITDFGSWPGWSSMRDCAKLPFGCLAGCPDIYNQLGCHDVYCVCDHFSLEFPIVSSAANNYCSGNSQDVASATSIFNAFCAQLRTTVTGPQSPTVVPTSSPSLPSSTSSSSSPSSSALPQATTLITTSVTTQHTTSIVETSIPVISTTTLEASGTAPS